MENNKIQLSSKLRLFVEEHIDLPPQELILKIKQNFAAECTNASCLCDSIEKTINLYQDNKNKTFNESIHQRIMKKIQECEANPYPTDRQ